MSDLVPNDPTRTVVGIQLPPSSRDTGLLLLDPSVEVVPFEPPLAADLKCRKLRHLRHRVDGLVCDLEQKGDLGSVSISSGIKSLGSQYMPAAKDTAQTPVAR